MQEFGGQRLASWRGGGRGSSNSHPRHYLLADAGHRGPSAALVPPVLDEAVESLAWPLMQSRGGSWDPADRGNPQNPDKNIDAAQKGTPILEG
jgi:hypothetical protein